MYLSIYLSNLILSCLILSYLILSYLIYLSIYLAISLSVCLSVYLSTCLSASLKTKLFCETSSGFELDNIKNEAILRGFLIFEVDNIKNKAILRDFLIFWTGQHPKRSNSARLLHFSHLTTSKTKQFCETSCKNGKLTAELTASCQYVLRFFQPICRNYCACHEKVMPGHTKCCTCNAKSS